MLLRHTFVVTFAALLLSLLALSAGSAPPVKAQQAARTVIFMVSANKLPDASIEPIVIIDGGSYKNPVEGGSSMEEISQFAADYYQKGQKYRVLFGGGEAGSLTVKRSTKDQECMRTEAEVVLQSSAKLNTNVKALATNSDSLGRGRASRRAPTASERAAVLSLAQDAFKQKGVPAALMSTLDTVNLTAMDLDDDGKAELVGSYVVKKIKGGQERYVLFLLAEPAGNNSYKAGLTGYAHYTQKDIMSGGDIDAIGQSGLYTERLVDQLDLDQSGAAELITLTTGFEGDSYTIYGKKGGGWQKIYEFGKYRCAF